MCLVILSIYYIVMIKESVFSYTINLLYCDDKGECVLVILSIYYIVIIKESVF